MKIKIFFIAMMLFTAFGFIAKAQPGAIDSTFNPGTGVNYFVETTAIQSDGKIIIGGWFTSYNETPINHIARFDTNGTLDASFNTGTGANDFIFTTAVQSDGKIIIGGWFTSYNETPINHIARLNANGTLDATFNLGNGASSDVRTTAIQSDGKIIIGGYFSFYNGATRSCIARLNADGTLDANFNPGTGANGTVYTTAIQSDGKIIIGGYFTSYNGTARNRIARLNANGTLDPTFNVGTGANGTVYTTAIQSDGKIIIGGDFTSYNETARNRIARLNTDGTLDPTFNPGTNNTIYTTAIQSDGKIIIGGDFTSCNGTAKNRIDRLNADGTLDATFNPGTGANSSIYTTAIQSNGKIIIGGNFTSYNGTGRNRVARIRTLNCIHSFSSITETACDSYTAHDGQIYTTSGIKTAVIPNAAGCDSTITINLTIKNSTTSSITETACDSYTAPDGQVYTTSGIKTAVIPNTAGCDSTITINLSINPVDVSSTINGTVITANASGATYQWMDCDNNYSPISGATNQSFTATTNGNYAVIVTQGLCSDTSVCTEINSVGMSSIQAKAAISIYPNPISNELNIEIEGNNGQLNFEILNSIGQVVFKGNLVDKTTVQTSNFAPGVYLIKLENNKTYEFKKLIKE